MSLCGCGCGKPAPLATRTDRKAGCIKGLPRQFIRGHNARGNQHARKQSPAYSVEDRGYLTECWVWQRATNNAGYGNMRDGRTSVSAHRFYFEQRNGPVPEGLELDHLCRNPACVNPDHLEPVTHAENLRRGRVARGQTTN